MEKVPATSSNGAATRAPNMNHVAAHVAND